jgi:hypothetical protein
LPDAIQSTNHPVGGVGIVQVSITKPRQ